MKQVLNSLVLAAAVVATSFNVSAAGELDKLLEQVKKEAQVENIKNIEVLWADLEVSGGTNIANQSLDVVFLVTVLFLLTDKQEAFNEAKRMIKSDGQILVVEWLSGDMSIGPVADKRVPKETITQLASSANFSQIKDIDAGKYHYGVLYKNT